MNIKTPRDRAGAFEPQLVGKRQTRLSGLDEKILGLYAGGMSVRDIEAHLQDLYGVQVARDTISRVTDAVLEDVQAWRTRPLERVYPIAYFDCLMVKVREDRSVRTPRLLSGDRCQRRGRARGARHLVARDRGRQVLAGRPERPAPPRCRGRPGLLRGRAHRLPRRDRSRVPPSVGSDLHRALCRGRGYAEVGCGSGWWCADRAGRGRHNQSVSRKARSLSGGWKRPGGVSGGVVLASAASFSAMSAWR